MSGPSVITGSVQAYNSRVPYKSGGTISNNSTTPNTKLDIAAVVCSDSSNVFDISVAGVTLNALLIGQINGSETALAASTVYAVYAIADATNNKVPGYFISTNKVNLPSYPDGYNICRRIGWALTDSSSHFVIFYQIGNDYQFDTPITVRASAALTTSFVAVSLDAVVPGNFRTQFSGLFTAATAGDSLFIRPTGSGSTNGNQVFTGAVVSQAEAITPFTYLPRLVTGVPSVDVKGTSTDTLLLTVTGFTDQV